MQVHNGYKKKEDEFIEDYFKIFTTTPVGLDAAAMEKNSKKNDSDNRSTNTSTRECNDVAHCSKNPSPHSSTQCAPARSTIKTVTRKKLGQIEGTISGGIVKVKEDIKGVETHVTQLVINHRELTEIVVERNVLLKELADQFNTKALHSLEEPKSDKQGPWKRNLWDGQVALTDKLNRLQTSLNKLEGDFKDLKEGQAGIKLELTRANRKHSYMEVMLERILLGMDGMYGAMLEENYRAVNVQPAPDQAILAPPPIIPLPVLPIQKKRQHKRKKNSS
ncbi:unnamed protein product [Orchesella dallaii]|uniref:Uncharacterized protein n=1 Tax=Orchesella dallaii TaxID=48710 RepID=A0ABP1PZZ9_9HEXA